MFGGWPNFEGLLLQCWGYPVLDSPWCSFAGASNVVVGTNPPYTLVDFFAMYPKYAGKNIALTGQFSSGSAVIASIDTTGLVVGQLVSDQSANTIIPDGATIAQINVAGPNGAITLSQAVAATGPVPFTVYVGPPLVPYAVINAYIALASASLVQARWQDTWPLGMALYVAHFLTLYLRSEGNCSATCAQAAVAGLKQGIAVGVSGGGVSQTLERTPGLDDWGMWNESSYGVQLATFGKSFGAGSILLV